MKFADGFESFLREVVNLNPTRLDALQQRITAIESFLENETVFGNIFIDLIPAGSWAFRTIIRPVADNDGFDADVLLHVQERQDWLAKDYIEQLHAAFSASGIYRDKAQKKMRGVRINYAGEFHVDIVPYLERTTLHYITNRKEPEGFGRFELSNPEQFTAWVDERQRITNGTFIKAVRLLKYLRDFKNTFTCKSIILTTLLGNQVNEIEAALAPGIYADVPSTLTTLLGKLAASLPESMPPVLDPGGTGDNFSERYRDEWSYPNFRTRIIDYAAKAAAAYGARDRAASLAAWQGIFGPEFMPDQLVKMAPLSPQSASVPWSGEQFIDRKYPFPIRIDPRASLRVSGRCTGFRDGQVSRRRGFRQFDLATTGNQVAKNRSLLFHATTNVQESYELYWKVRNGGEEAARLGQLRGEITRDTGSHTKEEFTLYKGSHYVECYLVTDRAVIARGKKKVTVT